MVTVVRETLIQNFRSEWPWGILILALFAITAVGSRHVFHIDEPSWTESVRMVGSEATTETDEADAKLSDFTVAERWRHAADELEGTVYRTLPVAGWKSGGSFRYYLVHTARERQSVPDIVREYADTVGARGAAWRSVLAMAKDHQRRVYGAERVEPGQQVFLLIPETRNAVTRASP